MDKKEIGLYIHIPFCKHKCYYCDFISFPNKDEIIGQYINKLIEEIKMEGLSKYKICTIYIGGGTPSYIPSKYIMKILNLINLKDAKEITIEINPGTVTKEILHDYYNAGINRLSIGLQSINNEVLRKIGRIHTVEQFLKTYKLARQIGFSNINIDLMIGLPNQEIQDIRKTVDYVHELRPEHISVYSLILEEGTILERKVFLKEITLPTDDEEREMYWLLKNELEKAGYKHYEISNYAKTGFEAKHNSDCWFQKEYIGVGLAAHSYIDKVRYSNTENINKYIENIKENRIIHEIQDEKEQKREFMILGLRTLEGVSIQKFKNKFIENPIYLYRVELNKLVKNNLLEIDANYIRLTKKGIDLANLVWEEF